MPARETKFIQDNFYHIYNRGVDRKKIFFETENYLYFLRLLKNNTKKYGVTIIAYCLMPNHFHLLVKIGVNGNLSQCIANTLNSYVQAINKRRGRKGPLFRARFKSIHITDNAYLIHLCRYIHLNPLKAKLVTSLKNWPFSNYPEFTNQRDGALFDADFFSAYFHNPQEYIDFVNSADIKSPKNFDEFLFE